MEEFSFLMDLHKWSLREVKQLSLRERDYWVREGLWRLENGRAARL